MKTSMKIKLLFNIVLIRGIYITTMEFELFEILWGLFIFLWIGWQTLFEKKSILE